MVIYFHEECRVYSRVDWRGRTLWTYQALVKPKGREPEWRDSDMNLTTKELEESLGPTGNPRDRSFSHMQEVGFHL